MDTSESVPLFDDSVPFVNEACGDTMWDDVLDQPNYTQRHPLPPLPLEIDRQNGQAAEKAGNSKDPDRVG